MFFNIIREGKIIIKKMVRELIYVYFLRGSSGLRRFYNDLKVRFLRELVKSRLVVVLGKISYIFMFYCS